MFDNENSLLDFLDLSLNRFQEYPDAKKPFTTERHLKFSSDRMGEIANDERPIPIAQGHPTGKVCPAQALAHSNAPRGSIAAQVFGRALDDKGQLSADTVRQEHYAEDHFIVTSEMQEKLAKTCRGGTGRVRIPDEIGRLFITYAYLGHIDVRPHDNPTGGPANVKACEFWAQEIGEANASARSSPVKACLLRVEGRSEVVQNKLTNGEGHHEVKLTWQGFIEITGDRVTRLLLSARGTADRHPKRSVEGDARQVVGFGI